MSIDQAVIALIAALNANTEAVNKLLAAQSAAPLNHAVANTAQMTQMTAAPTTHNAPAANAMPAAPNFMAMAQPAAQVAAPAAPFSNAQGLFDYTGAAYQSMGAEKGGKIQTILTGLGIGNLNDVKPEQYGVFWQQVEALKASA